MMPHFVKSFSTSGEIFFVKSLILWCLFLSNHDRAICAGYRLRESGEPAREHLPQLALAHRTVCLLGELTLVKDLFPSIMPCGSTYSNNAHFPNTTGMESKHIRRNLTSWSKLGRERGGEAKRVKEFQLQFLTGASIDYWTLLVVFHALVFCE